jgi:hypothetical protein
VTVAAEGEGEIGTDTAFTRTAYPTGYRNHPGGGTVRSVREHLGHRQGFKGCFTGSYRFKTIDSSQDRSLRIKNTAYIIDIRRVSV